MKIGTFYAMAILVFLGLSLAACGGNTAPVTYALDEFRIGGEFSFSGEYAIEGPGEVIASTYTAEGNLLILFRATVCTYFTSETRVCAPHSGYLELSGGLEGIDVSLCGELIQAEACYELGHNFREVEPEDSE